MQTDRKKVVKSLGLHHFFVIILIAAYKRSEVPSDLFWISALTSPPRNSPALNFSKLQSYGTNKVLLLIGFIIVGIEVFILP